MHTWDLEQNSNILLALTLLLWLRTRSRRWGVRPINRLRKQQGEYWNLFLQMKEHDEEQFFQYTLMDAQMFNQLLSMLKVRLRKRKTNVTLGAEERLALTLRYLATGDQIHSIAWGYRVGRTTARQVIIETCSIIWDVLSPIYLPRPTEEDWKQISQQFYNIWNLPNCVGALDGKHIAIQNPPNSGSLYYNYKKYHSIVLMAACDAKYRFSMIDVGGLGSDNDAGIFRQSDFGRAMLEGNLNLPPPVPLPNKGTSFPYFFVRDEGFPQKECLMRPYPGRHLSEEKLIFNYRLSRARRTIENAFGILASRWKVFRKPILAYPETVDKIILACTWLHNFIMKQEDELDNNNRRYCPGTFVDREIVELGIVQPGDWRSEGNTWRSNVSIVQGHRATRRAMSLRDELSNYCVNEGAVPWQQSYVNRGKILLCRNVSITKVFDKRG